jgi:O-antigen/teichoic acid export membrane protein
MRHSLARLRALRGEIGWVVAGQAAAALGALASIKVLTSWLGPEGYGQLAIGLAIAGALHLFLYGPIEQTVLRFASLAVERCQLGPCVESIESTHRYIASGLLACGAIASLALALAGETRWAWLAMLSTLLGLTIGAGASAASGLTAWRQRRLVAMHQAADAWLRLLFAMAALWIAGASPLAALCGILLAAACVATSQVHRARRQPRLRMVDEPAPDAVLAADARAQMRAYALPFIAFAAFAAIGAYADRWLVLVLLDPASVGLYAALLQLASAPVALFVAMTNQLVVPVIFARAGKARGPSEIADARRLARWLLWWYGAALSVAVVAAWLLAPLLVPLLTNDTFAAASDLLWLLVLGAALFAVGQAMVLSGLAAVRPGIYIIPKAVQAAALVACAWLLVPRFGLPGMAWATVAAAALYILSVHLTNRALSPTLAGPRASTEAE